MWMEVGELSRPRCGARGRVVLSLTRDLSGEHAVCPSSEPKDNMTACNLFTQVCISGVSNHSDAHRAPAGRR